MVSYLKDNNINYVPITMRIFGENLTIKHGPLSMERYEYNNEINIDWLKEYNSMESLYYLIPQIKIDISEDTYVFIHINCNDEKVGGILLESDKRVFCDGDAKTIKKMSVQYNDNVCEEKLKKGKYIFIPYLLGNKKDCKINIKIQTPIKVSVSLNRIKDEFKKYTIEGKVKCGGENMYK